VRYLENTPLLGIYEDAHKKSIDIVLFNTYILGSSDFLLLLDFRAFDTHIFKKKEKKTFSDVVNSFTITIIARNG
jgi:hypothetical protein